MRCEPYGPGAEERVREQENAGLPIEDEDPVCLLHLESRIKRVRDYDVGEQVAFVDKTSSNDAAALRSDSAVQILAVGESAAVIKAHGIRQCAVETVDAHIDVAQNRSPVDRHSQRAHGWRELTIVRHEVKDGAPARLGTATDGYRKRMLAAHRGDDVAYIARE